jgi:outer membrane protein W
MKRLIIITAVIFVTVTRLSAGEDGSRTAIFVNLGMSGALTPDEFDKTDAPGLNTGCEFGYRISPRIISTLFFHLNKFELNASGSRLTGKLIDYAYGFNFRFYPNRRSSEARPYLLIGFGYTTFRGFARYSLGDGRHVDFTDWAGDETAETVTVAGGLEVCLSNATCLFADVGYRTAFAENQRISFLPIRLGLAFY